MDGTRRRSVMRSGHTPSLAGGNTRSRFCPGVSENALTPVAGRLVSTVVATAPAVIEIGRP